MDGTYSDGVDEMTASVSAIRPDIYAAARRKALAAEDNWPVMLGCAETLAGSPHHGDKAFARRIREAYSADMRRRIDEIANAERPRGKSSRVSFAADETGLSIALRFRSRWVEIIAYAALIAGGMLYATGWL
jgi:hypothetical protein